MSQADKSPDPPPTAAESLLGLTLGDGWTVSQIVQASPEATGGNFSVGYEVTNESGDRGFLKAIDFAKGLGAIDPVLALQISTAAFAYEREVLEKCSRERMNRVIGVLGSGTVGVQGFAVPQVSYLIFEWAEGDVRAFLDTSRWLDASVIFRSLHDVAVGLQQLHTHGLAHRDVKPSNVLVMPSAVSKLADLGRAAYGQHPDPLDPNDELLFAGDMTYAPPEALYRHRIENRDDRLRAADAYLLGSLVLFMFTRVSAAAALQVELHPDHRESAWGGTFVEVLPFLRDGFDSVMRRLEKDLPTELADVAAIVGQLCEPDPSLRGHPKTRAEAVGSQYGLRRYVAWLNLLRRQAELGVRRAILR